MKHMLIDLVSAPRRIREIRVSNKNFVDYIHIVYQELGLAIAPIALVHRKSSFDFWQENRNPEEYGYGMHWSHRDNSFEAYIHCYLHTQKGLLKVSVSTIDKQSGESQVQLADDILDVFSDCSVSLSKNKQKYSKIRKYVTVFSTQRALSGTYQAPNLFVFPDIRRETDVGCIIETNEVSEKLRLGSLERQAENYAAALTLASQNIFIPTFSHFSVDENIPQEKGEFFDDKKMFERDDYSPGEVREYRSKTEIIEATDLVRQGKLILPLHAGDFVSVVLKEQKLLNAALCFHSGLALRYSDSLTPSSTGYELLAYVSAIEALLETEHKILECSSCGEPVNCGPGYITRAFKQFVKVTSEENPILEEAFDDLYKIRSKLLHQGKRMHKTEQNYSAGPPVSFSKKSSFGPLPDYYSQISDWTGWLIRRHIYWNYLD